ncbi:GNAT family N-acetyltransferase [Gordonia sp. PP30]|uniref:GNAT family N-acetyltransferase n=1 Tax=Gordonia sp. PP30 TaxID=2935861 RepID=UPI001FFF6492|nr:GNAT family N-acetyltransferase [Gordonia sp. PP30]UQE74259.1 GNAT family N-acetyltransferase [Gordonia sp. PP30]
MTIRKLTDTDGEALRTLWGSLSERDRTLIREDLTDPGLFDQLLAGSDYRWACEDDGRLLGYATVHRLPGWSNHVGELRLVVSADARGRGYGAELAKEAMRSAFSDGVTKIVIELPTDAEGAVALFSRLGFTGEALLRDHLKTRDGDTHDLLVLAHHVEDGMNTMAYTGIADELV